MLISFSVENYLSFRDRTELNLQSSSAVNELPGNILSAPRMGTGGREQELPCLRSVALVGANASGKTNMLKAVAVARDFILSMRLGGGGDSQRILNKRHSPFLLDAEKREKPCRFEFCVLLEKVYYRYGFSVTRGRVREEWLLLADKGKERLVFSRTAREEDGSDYTWGSGFRKLKTIAEGQDMVRDDTLLLGIADKFKVREASVFIDFLARFRPIDARGQLRTPSENKEMLAMLLKFADIGIIGLSITEEEDQMPDELKQDFDRLTEQVEGSDREAVDKLGEFMSVMLNKPRQKVKRLHFLYRDSSGNETPIPLELQSEGTMTFLELFCNILAHYSANTVLLCDEIESSLHPMLCEAFFDLFHTMPGNKAQLIFTTHNTLLLNSENFRRDQIYITEKDASGQSTLVGLDEYKGVRKGASYGKHYLDGRFGGVPIINPRYKRELYKALESILKEKAQSGEKVHG